MQSLFFRAAQKGGQRSKKFPLSSGFIAKLPRRFSGESHEAPFRYAE
jgi:hypothetical protein